MPDPLLGKPLIMWGGIFTGLLFIATAAAGYATVKGIYRIPVKWHIRIAYLSLASGLLHGIMGALSFL